MIEFHADFGRLLRKDIPLDPDAAAGDGAAVETRAV
jgi:hypothetical protein